MKFEIGEAMTKIGYSKDTQFDFAKYDYCIIIQGKQIHYQSLQLGMQCNSF